MTRFIYFLIVLGLFTSLTLGCQSTTGETAREQLSDSSITSSVKSHLASEDRIGTLTQVGVKTVEGTVYLTGVVPSSDEKLRAEQIASNVRGVNRVANNIQVRGQ